MGEFMPDPLDMRRLIGLSRTGLPPRIGDRCGERSGERDGEREGLREGERLGERDWLANQRRRLSGDLVISFSNCSMQT